MRIRLTDAVQNIARNFRARGNSAGLMDLYTKAVHADLLIEEFHRGQIAALLDVGRTAGALDAYQRLTVVWSKVFGKEPSPETRALYQRIVSSGVSPE